MKNSVSGLFADKTPVEGFSSFTGSDLPPPLSGFFFGSLVVEWLQAYAEDHEKVCNPPHDQANDGAEAYAIALEELVTELLVNQPSELFDHTGSGCGPFVAVQHIFHHEVEPQGYLKFVFEFEITFTITQKPYLCHSRQCYAQ